MEKYKYIWRFSIFILLTAFTLSACSKKGNKQGDSSAVTPAPTAAVPAVTAPAVTGQAQSGNNTSENVSGNTTAPAVASYELTETVYTSGNNIKVKYPQIKGLSDTVRQDAINSIIKKDAMKYVEDNKAGDAVLETNYEIALKGDNLLSIKYTSYSNYPGAAHPADTFFTTDIDIKNALKVKLSDAVNISDYLIQTIKKSSTYTGPLDTGNTNITSITKDSMDALTADALTKSDADTDYNAYYSYFTKDSLGISIEQPFAAGGYALYEIRYEDIISYINYQNNIWKDFPGLLSSIQASGNTEAGQNEAQAEISTAFKGRVPLTGGSIEDFIPVGYKLLEIIPGEKALAEGDLNNDLISDAAFIIEGARTPDKAGTRNLVIILGSGKGTYKLAVITEAFILREDEGGAWGDPFEGITIKDGAVTVSLFGGNSLRWGYTYEFAYILNEWKLTGYTELSSDAFTDESLEIKYDLRSGKYKVTSTDKNGAARAVEGKGEPPVIKLAGFTGTENIINFDYDLEAAEVTEDTVKISDLKDFKPIEEQIFMENFENWGKVRFVPGIGNFSADWKLEMYLADAKDNVLYQFPSFYGNKWAFYELGAVAFQDVNNDGLKDVIVIAEYMTGIGPTAAETFPVAGVYFQQDKKFVSQPDLDDEINSKGLNKTVEMVIKYVKSKAVKIDTEASDKGIKPVAVDELLLGSFYSNRWIDIDQTVPRLKGGENYQLYSADGFAGTADGGAPKLDEDFNTFYMLAMKNSPKDYRIAVGTDKELHYVVPFNAGDEFYDSIARQFFKEQGFTEYKPAHLAGYSLDLDGDGVDEHIITMYSFEMDDNNSMYMGTYTAEGNYSYVLLYDEKEDIINIVDEAYKSKADDFMAESLGVKKGTQLIDLAMPEFIGAVDISGDGVCEVIMGYSVYEGYTYGVYEYKDRTLKNVLKAGFGV